MDDRGRRRFWRDLRHLLCGPAGAGRRQIDQRREWRKGRRARRIMSEPVHPLVALTDAGLDALLRRAVRVTLVLGVLAALVVWKASGWRNAAMLAAGAAISAASILEWQRL